MCNRRNGRKISIPFICVLMVCILLCSLSATTAGAIIADHNSATAFFSIPTDAIVQAKATLHIAYGHTSHGSQLTTGMTGLVNFMNGLGYPADLYAYNNGGTGGALDLRDTPFSGASDLGNPNRTAWEQATRDYLGLPDANGRGSTRPDVNVIIWSWCGQVDGSEEDINLYLNLMNGLEQDYHNVYFVYMTGHLNGTGATGNVNIRNQQIRDYCIANDKILYDFADIESYDPDGLVNYMLLLANDNCDYDSDDNGTRDRNWAIDWQNLHTVNVDWYNCSSAHSQPLNANRKAYAAWWLWARLAGWGQCIDAPSELTAEADSYLAQIVLNWTDNSTEPSNEDSFIIQRSVNGGIWDNNYASVTTDVNTYTDVSLAPASYNYRVVAHLNDDGSGNPCDSAPSNTATAVIVSTSPPAAPSDLLATGNSQNQTVSLVWDDNSTNEDGFTIQRQVNSGAWNNNYAGTVADVNVFVDDVNVSPGTYNYRVIAYNIYGDSTASNESQVIIVDIPAAPSELTADSESGTVTLGWNDNSDSETGFIVQRRVDSGVWDNNYAVVDANLESYLDDNNGLPPLPNGTYTYRVLASNENGNSSPSNEAYAVISTDVPVAPSNLAADVNGFDVTLIWTDNSDNEENFVIERAVDSGRWYILDDSVAPDTQIYYDRVLLPDHIYTYRIKAENGLGESGYSNETSAEVVQTYYDIILKQNVNNYTGCRDTYLDSANPTYNYGNDPYDYVRNSPKRNFIIGFDLPTEIIGKQINSATLVLYCWSISSWQAGQYLELYRVTEQWEEGTANGAYQEGSASWNIRTGSNEWATPGGTYEPNLIDSSLIPQTSYYPQFDITAVVQDWADGVVPNYGLLLLNNTPVTTGIKASEYSEYGRPYLSINYTDITTMCPNLYGDGLVDFRDFSILADEWLSGGANPFADLDGDNSVDISDLNVFCGYWLTDCEQ